MSGNISVTNDSFINREIGLTNKNFIQLTIL